MDKETNLLIAKQYLYRTVTSRDLSDWAVSMLEQGFDSRNIRILASMFKAQIYCETEDYFHRVLKDLGWQYPSQEECVEKYVQSLISDIADGRIAPFDGCIKLKDVYYAFDCPWHLSNWRALYWNAEEVSEEESNELILEEAKRIMSGEPPEHLDGDLSTLGGRTRQGILSLIWGKIFNR